MARPLKIGLYVLVAVVAMVIIAAVTFASLLNANEVRDRLVEQTKERTGRDLVIEGDLEVRFFPWLAIGVGSTTLSNAQGFGDEPFASFEQARLSMRLFPLLLRREVSIGEAEIDSLHVNLAVAGDGRSNWQDLLQREGKGAERAGAGAAATFDIASIDVSDASLSYRNAQSGDTYRLTDVNMKSGPVTLGDGVQLEGGLRFALEPAGVSGNIELETVATFDPKAGAVALDDLEIDGLIEGFADVPTTLRVAAPRLEVNTKEKVVTLGDVETSVLGIDIDASVEPFSYAGDLTAAAAISVAAFSPRKLMQRLRIHAPATADPNALGNARLDAKAKLTAEALALNNLRLTIDETNVSGSLSIPRQAGGRYRFDLQANRIDVNRYMTAAEPHAAKTDRDPAAVEALAKPIRRLDARGRLKVGEALLGAMRLRKVEVGVDSANGRLRIQPASAMLYEGTFSGDLSINASGATPALSVNGKIGSVKLRGLAKAMFDEERVTGTFNGSFRLSGRGDGFGAVRRSLSGNMSFELLEGAFEGVDVWYQVRRAYALLKQRPAPEPVLPARTRFTKITASGPVRDGVFRNDNLLAELQFMRITGRGKIDLAAETLDYGIRARLLDEPELAARVRAEGLEELMRVVIPIRIKGPLADPAIEPDLEGTLEEHVTAELATRVFDEVRRRIDEQEAPEPAERPDAGKEPAPEEKPKEEGQSIEDALKEIFNW